SSPYPMRARSPGLRDPAFGDVEAAHDLEARGDARIELDRRRGDAAQHAVHAEAHAVVALVRLEMHVRGSALDRVHQHLVDELDHLRVVGAGRIDPGFARGAVLVDAVELEVLEPLGIIHAFDDRAARGEYLFDRAYELVFLDQDRLDQVVGLEADFLQAAQAGRFGHADVQPL